MRMRAVCPFRINLPGSVIVPQYGSNKNYCVYFPLEFEFRGKSCVEWENAGENGMSCFLPCILLLYIEWIWTNYCKLSQNFVGAIRTTTINCRVSFIDLYLVFPRNFRIVFLPHTNTVILLEPYCGYLWSGTLEMFLASLFYDRICLRIDVFKINYCPNILFIF